MTEMRGTKHSDLANFASARPSNSGISRSVRSRSILGAAPLSTSSAEEPLGAVNTWQPRSLRLAVTSSRTPWSSSATRMQRFRGFSGDALEVLIESAEGLSVRCMKGGGHKSWSRAATGATAPIYLTRTRSVADGVDRSAACRRPRSDFGNGPGRRPRCAPLPGQAAADAASGQPMGALATKPNLPTGGPPTTVWDSLHACPHRFHAREVRVVMERQRTCYARLQAWVVAVSLRRLLLKYKKCKVSITVKTGLLG